MRQLEAVDDMVLRAAYHWRYKGRWNSLAVKADSRPQLLRGASHEEFITEHFWGYARAGAGRTNEYQVAHPRWEIYPVLEYQIDCDFARLYGPVFGELRGRKPQSVFLAEGSAISVYSKRAI